MDFAKLLQIVEDGVAFAENLTPLATALGGPIVGDAIKAVQSVNDVAHNVFARVNEADQVFAEDNQAKINELINRLAAENDKLAEAIRNS